MRYYWYIASIPAINTRFPTGAPTFSTSIPCPKIRVPPNQALRCELFCQKSRLGRPPESSTNAVYMSPICAHAEMILPKVAVESSSRSTNLRENFTAQAKSRSTNFRENFAVQAKSRSTNFRENFAVQAKSRSTNFLENLPL